MKKEVSIVQYLCEAAEKGEKIKGRSFSLKMIVHFWIDFLGVNWGNKYVKTS